MISEREEKFTFKYNGDLEYIDFDTLLVSQVHFTEFIKELKSALIPTGELKIKVKSLPPSSFPIELFLQISESISQIQNTALWIGGGILGAGGLTGAINSIIDFYKNIFSKDIKAIKSNPDTTIFVFSDLREIELPTPIYSALKDHPKIRLELGKSFESISKDSDIESVEIIGKDNDILEKIDRELFRYFDQENLDKPFDGEVEVREKKLDSQNLSIFSVTFSKGFKWRFIYKGRKEYIQIDDEEFLLKVTKGEISFTNGDILVCDIILKQSFSEIANTYITDKMTVVKVSDIKPRGKQTAMALT